MEASIRTAHFYITGKPLNDINFTPVRGFEGIRESSLKIGDYDLNVAVVNGTENARKFIEMMDKENEHA